MPEFTVEHPEHGELTVSIDGVVPTEDLEKDYIPRAQLETRIRDARREASRGLFTRDSALEDEELRRAMAEAHGDFFREALAIKPKEGEVEQLRAQIVATEVKPLQEKLDGAAKSIETLRRKARDGEIRAAIGGVKEQFQPLALAMLRERLAYNGDSDGWFVTEEDSPSDEPRFMYAAKPTDGRPYQTVGEFVQALRDSGKYPDWWDSRGRAGAGYEGGGGETGDIDLKAYLAMSPTQQSDLYRKDPKKWRELMDAKQEAAEAKLLDGSS